MNSTHKNLLVVVVLQCIGVRWNSYTWNTWNSHSPNTTDYYKEHPNQQNTSLKKIPQTHLNAEVPSPLQPIPQPQQCLLATLVHRQLVQVQITWYPLTSQQPHCSGDKCLPATITWLSLLQLPTPSTLTTITLLKASMDKRLLVATTGILLFWRAGSYKKSYCRFTGLEYQFIKCYLRR